ncbi:Alcohol dehydrogenase class IV OS=Ureibacillus acetophenoni OX=614649 GN=SAMN05877842_11786 PE=3 SV=1 [Ureibacillus acetophenoni]
MKSYSEFSIPNSVFYGQNSLSQLGEQVKAYGKKVLLISDRVIEKIGHVKTCLNALEDLDLAFVSYLDATQNQLMNM